jgi:exosortase A-associated hydrolase 2
LTAGGIKAAFIEGPAGRIFVTARTPVAQGGGSVLVVPPFAEEMNKSRRMFADLAEALRARGIATVIPDLHGTGDSDGEFRDAGWDQWQTDVQRVSDWAAQQGWPVRALLGMRLGCALAAAVAHQLPQPVERTVFWQPVMEGARFLNQFFRLRVAAAMAGTKERESVADIRAQLRAGSVIEVAGYDLSPRLAEQLEGVRLKELIGPKLGVLHWMEVVRSADSTLPDASRQAIEMLRESGMSLHTDTVCGEPFWASTELVRVPDLIERTVRTLAPAA